MNPNSPEGGRQPVSDAFRYQRSGLDIIGEDLKLMAFLRLTRKSMNLFFRGRDIISLRPQFMGSHEPAIKGLIEHYADSGYADFLVDVGANIGLTSCQSGRKFKQVHMFEPNPDCFSILRVNARIALNNSHYELNEYGLGDAAATTTLTVPIHNWGGAFVKGAGNSYSDDILAAKDGFDRVDANNYYEVQIRIEKAEDVFRRLFQSFAGQGLTSGVIKIDVEGYEPVVLGALAATIPADVRAMVVFECWDKDLNPAQVLAPFKGRAVCYKIAENKPYQRSWPVLLKALSLLFRPRLTTQLEPARQGNMSGDLALEIHRVAG